MLLWLFTIKTFEIKQSLCQNVIRGDWRKPVKQKRNLISNSTIRRLILKMMLAWPRRKFFLPSFIYGRNINFPSRLSYRHREGVFFASEKCFYLLRKHFTICDQIKCFICCGRLLILFHCVSYNPLGSNSRTFLFGIVLKCFWKVFVHFQGYGFLWVALCVEMMEDPSLKPNLWSAPDKVCSHFLFFG